MAKENPKMLPHKSEKENKNNFQKENAIKFWKPQGLRG